MPSELRRMAQHIHVSPDTQGFFFVSLATMAIFPPSLLTSPRISNLPELFFVSQALELSSAFIFKILLLIRLIAPKRNLFPLNLEGKDLLDPRHPLTDHDSPQIC